MTTRLTHESSVTALVAAFVQQVKPLAQVQTVLIEHAEEADQVWTVIDAEPFDRDARTPIYTAELAALDQAGGADVTFRLVNRREYGQCNLSGIVPETADVVWSRVPVADRA